MVDGMLRTKVWRICREESKQFFYLIIGKLVVFLIPLFCLRKTFSINRNSFCFVGKFVVEVFVKEYLYDDFVFITIIT